MHILVYIAFKYTASWKCKIAPCIPPEGSLRWLQLGSQGTCRQVKKTCRQQCMLQNGASHSSYLQYSSTETSKVISIMKRNQRARG